MTLKDMSNGLNEDQKKQLVVTIADCCGDELIFENFSESLGLMLENISGFEAISDSSFHKLVDELWPIYISGGKDMFNKQSKTEEKQVGKVKTNDKVKTTSATDNKPVVDNEPVILKAVRIPAKMNTHSGPI